MSSIMESGGDKVTITTPRLVLRGAREDDAESLYEVLSDPEVMKYWSELAHPSFERTRQWIANMIAAPQNGATDFVVTLKETDQAIGKIGIWQQNEIGYLLNATYWRRGLCLEAFNALLPYFFGEKGFEVVTADTDPDNAASIALLKKLGFEVTGFEKGTFQLGETWADSCYFGLRKEKWESSAGRSCLAEKQAKPV